MLTLGLALCAGLALADDAATPQPPASPSPPTSPADGTPARRHHNRGREMIQELTQKLSLTAEQQGQVAAILRTDRQQMRELHDDQTMSDDDKHARMKEMKAATHGQIRALLTPDQQKIFDALPEHGKPANTP
jgi:hypothetical protein